MHDKYDDHLSRRALLASLGASLGAVGAASLIPAFAAPADRGDPIMWTIPNSGEAIPAVGMGTWITFNVGEDVGLRNARAQVLQAFFDNGGRVIDSSPMYGSSEEVVGYCLKRVERTRRPRSPPRKSGRCCSRSARARSRIRASSGAARSST
jgi:hypothetical protein